MKNNAAPSRKNKGLARKAGHDPRAAALAVLMEVVHGNEDSQAALNRALKREGFSVAPSDKGLCTELVYGTLRRYLRLQDFAGAFLKKADKLPPEMRLLLLQSLYEMAFLRVPQYAGVNWAVNHVRNRFGKGLAAVANGALRSMQRGLVQFRREEDTGGKDLGDAASQARRHGAPLWLAELWREAYGPDNCELLLRASAAAPPSGLRLNRARPDWPEKHKALASGPEAPLAVGPAGLAFSGSLPFAARELIRRGAASRQGMAAYEALEALEPGSWPGPVWDCCAGRGGKSLPLLEQGLPVALASDVSLARLRGFASEYGRLGLAQPPLPILGLLDASDPEARPVRMEDVPGKEPQSACRQDAVPAPVGNPTSPEPLSLREADAAPSAPAKDAAPDETAPAPPEKFGTILIDAPCSGLGTLARRPEIRLRRTPEDLAQLAGLQARILESVWRRLLPGGRALYMTCTLNPAENQGQIARFLREHPDARLHGEFQTPFDSPLGEFFYAARLDKQG